MSRLTSALNQRRVLLMDGAAGTEFLRAGFQVGAGFERFNQTDPERVLALHRGYADAGAEVLLTNTFQAWARPQSSAWFNAGWHALRYSEGRDTTSGAMHALRSTSGRATHNTASLNHAQSSNIADVFATAVSLARTAAPCAVVLADVGPVSELTGDILELLHGCEAADGILLETWSDCDQLRRFAQIYKSASCAIPLLASFTFRREAQSLTTFKDASPEDCARAAIESGCLALGVNCGLDIGRDELLEIVERYRSVVALPVFVRPNAGAPGDDGGLRTPEIMAAWLPRLFAAGVRMIGGCCGTTPAHIAAFRKGVDEWNAKTP